MTEHTKQRQEIGFLGENLAARYLTSKHYAILDRNYRKPWGEIDIIATTKDNILVFIEVKANSTIFRGDFQPEVRADQRKLHKVIRTASLYMLHEIKDPQREWRIDVIAVTLDRVHRKANIKHFINVTE